MSSPQSQKWMAFLSDTFLDEESQNSSALFWGSQPSCDPVDCCVENDSSKVDSDEFEKTCPKKRSREESCGAPGNKACREKMRRDRLNDRFVELSAALEPGRPPKSDKATILSDAVRVITQLRAEAQQLKESNEQLRDGIKELKAEKNELREEKMRLKSEKDRLEQQLKTMAMPPSFMPHPAAALHAHHAAAAAAAFHAQIQAASTKTGGASAAGPLPGFPGMAMWQWMPPAVVDTSQDHVLRPPVA
ncbi:hypothetical protein SELMODRAFT_165311 [Selaginella moellendorffii]|uniref:BHLH domain-containing protein n=1 Tax=Selaginella moellendorffii TaxID=88036 RepID=D8QU30_SELML|nr:transcription factor ILR3 [Selaginella moellendorffii]XP_002962764.1 transcription factor ILR3 [Selaginella moellendorffii]EFJ35991.1 hypothetical protein SELMODRAFT_165556 [Selaginella moellendorffii]EFJ36227.1 hypothetical protein SELMODRAFT_165311 [Selaginella moellendorffii]|eukprot:XP_002962528.1 transcription factor ILR3 [Selaginella moellendorffii]